MSGHRYLAGEETPWANAVPTVHQPPGCGTDAMVVPTGPRLCAHQQSLQSDAAAGRDSSPTLTQRSVRRRLPQPHPLVHGDDQHDSTAPQRAAVSGGSMERAPPRTDAAKGDSTGRVGHQAGGLQQSSLGESLPGRSNKMCQSSQRGLDCHCESRR